MWETLALKKPLYIKILASTKSRIRLRDANKSIVKVTHLYKGRVGNCKNTCTQKKSNGPCRRCKGYFLKGRIVSTQKAAYFAAFDYKILTEAELSIHLL